MEKNVLLELTDFEKISDDEERLYEELLFEVKTKLLDKELKYLIRKPSVRKEMLEKYGEKAFLLPEKLKFPIIDPRTGKVHCGLLLAAYFRANQWKKKHPEYEEVAKKAEKLFEKMKCENKIHVKLNENQVIPIDKFIALYV